MNPHSRREFLRTSFAAAVGTLALYPTLSFAQAADPFELLVLGDSIMWGQGIREDLKFSTQIENWLHETVFDRKREVHRTVEAHSGATIFAEKDPVRGIDQRLDEEINVSNPPIFLQVESAFKKLASRYPGTPRSELGEVVDLILMDGGANDFGMRQIFLKGELSDQTIRKYASDYCLHGMTALLRLVCCSFPKARIVVTGYYPLVSPLTNPRVLSRTALGALGIKGDINMPFHKDGKRRDEWSRRSYSWFKYSDEFLSMAVENANEAYPSPNAPRVIFAPIPFKPEHAYATFDKDPSQNDKSLLWYTRDRLVTQDDRYDDRRNTICVEKGLKLSKLEKRICIRAATFHPNHKGAAFYAEQIKLALQPYLDQLRME